MNLLFLNPAVRRATATIFWIASLWATTRCASAIQFIPLSGTLIAWDVSGDGTTVVGDTGGAGFSWTFQNGIQTLTGLTSAKAASHDGSIIAGNINELNEVAALWTKAGGAQPIGPMPPQTAFSIATAISSDGSVVAGSTSKMTGPQSAFRWDTSIGVETISEDLTGGIDSANAVSDDGSFIVGSDSLSAFEWTRATGLVKLPGITGNSDAWGVSADGSTVVGNENGQAFRWTTTTGMTGLGDLPGGLFNSAAWDVTPDGNTVVGNGTTDRGLEAFVWTKATGMQSLMDLLTQSGVNLNGWQLQAARGISDSGQVIVGTGLNPQGNTQAWVIVIPEPSLFILAVPGIIALAMRRTRTSHDRV